jgi:hypothetical protein
LLKTFVLFEILMLFYIGLAVGYLFKNKYKEKAHILLTRVSFGCVLPKMCILSGMGLLLFVDKFIVEIEVINEILFANLSLKVVLDKDER